VGGRHDPDPHAFMPLLALTVLTLFGQPG
jgi:hypothetical protein